TQGIRLDHVCFTYPSTTRRVLEDVSLDLAPGTVVAIVGENGAGKSTLVKLLCRLYQPDEGRILIDGADLARMPVEQWRSRGAGRSPGEIWRGYTRWPDHDPGVPSLQHGADGGSHRRARRCACR